MQGRSCLIVSDVHLGAVSPANETAFQDFLRREAPAWPELLINGDLFDFWFEYRTVILRRHFTTLRLLADLVDANIRLRLVGGNHDAWAGEFLREEVGIELIDGPVVTDVGGRRAYVAHGDGLAGGDWGYRVLKRLIRSRAARFAFRQLHPDRAARWVERVSRTAGREAGRAGDTQRMRAAALSAHADQLLRERPEVQLVVFGHCHSPELREVGGGRYYLNPGDWVNHCSYAYVRDEEIRITCWNRE